ncbi:hypothetical protein FHR22_004276 [Sphingopyxis panaciterrae]|uniref:hypothetical protein n=1 Tax=Sphingopyxis panaciterrae TaxID=363841 RepID=UPI001423C978|nr:hypothetical protein [Sphingopyxis panaciterrae]NIJ39526.1 hypothetical protein [Sphingopyxis panaciterrae]
MHCDRKNRRIHLIRLMAACILFGGPLPAGAHMNEGGVAKSSSAGVLSAETRRDIEEFLTAQLRTKKISPDLGSIILARIDALASGWPVPEPDKQPRTTAYPSVGQQIEWQSGLDDIAIDFRHRFPTGFKPKPNHIVMEDEPRQRPSQDEILWFAPIAIIEAQGALSEELKAKKLTPRGRGKGSQPLSRKHLGTYASPVRIALTGIAVVDEAIPSVLTDIQAKHRDLKLDQKSFPSAVAEANLIIPEERYGGDAVAHVIYCIRDGNCRSLAELARPNALENERIPENESRDFLENIYFTNPYGAHRASRALVRLNEDGSIAEAYCSLDDIGFDASKRSLRSGGEILKKCLEAAIGY